MPVTDAFAEDAEAVRSMVSYVLQGRDAPMAAATADLLGRHDGIAIINDVFVPVLDEVGRRYDSGAFFLPQLMAAAEAVKAGFDVIRAQTAEGVPEEGACVSAMPGGSAATGSATPDADRAIIVATVEGDIHDIGKNIVKMLLENYGFSVIDLGRDVAPEAVLAAVRETGARLVGLSALMTTTVGAMERTISLVHEACPEVRLMVGGAVVTAEFAASIGADFYAKDAAESARIATAFFG